MPDKIKYNPKKYKLKSNKEFYDHMNKVERQDKGRREQFLNMISDNLKLPSDVLVGAPIITTIGRNEICIENYKGIMEYNNSLIKILTKIGNVQIIGKNLCITYFSNDEMKIIGTIHSINYVNEHSPKDNNKRKK